VSKCANPVCSEKFLRLREGKIFLLSPTPEVEAATGGFAPALYERFWLCDWYCKRLTLIWGGTEVKLVPMPQPAISSPPAAREEIKQKQNTEMRCRTLVALE
jgi:hypothetical protein